jgi:hypothetical protein
MSDPNTRTDAEPLSAGEGSYSLAAPFLEYEYPEDFPEQRAVEDLIKVATESFPKMLPLNSYSARVHARTNWLRHIVFGAAPIFGRAAAKQGWNVNLTRRRFDHFVVKVAEAGKARPALRQLASSQEWRSIDDALFPHRRPAKLKGRPKSVPVDAEKLRAYRSEFSQEDFADKCDVSLATIQRGEDGACWSEGAFSKVADAISVLTGKTVRPGELQKRQKP